MLDRRRFVVEMPALGAASALSPPECAVFAPQRPLAPRSEVIRTLVERKDLRVVAAMHDVATERVTFFA